MDGEISVLKRDGSIENFVLAKLNCSIGNGFVSSGEPHERNSPTSRGLAEAVQMYLRKSRPNSAVPSDHLAELVELVLVQTGYCAAGMAIRHHHQLREKMRRWVKVAYTRPRGVGLTQKQWDKGRIVQLLTSTYELDTPAARVIAGRVEQLVFNCGLKVVTSEFVESLTQCELMAWGLLPNALRVKRSTRASDSIPLPNQIDPK